MVFGRWLGHASFELDFNGFVVLVDPLLSDNPMCPVKLEDYLKLKERIDIVAVTHDHYDHLGDTVNILKAHPETKLFCSFDLAMYIKSQIDLDDSRIIPGNVGGFIKEGKVELALTKAVHTSEHSDPTGVVVRGEGVTVYHAGDTGLFLDMELIGNLFKPDYALLPIGGRFTMDVDQALMAAKMIRPTKAVIPIHYNTWPLIHADVEEFSRKFKDAGLNFLIPKPGEVIGL